MVILISGKGNSVHAHGAPSRECLEAPAGQKNQVFRGWGRGGGANGELPGSLLFGA